MTEIGMGRVVIFIGYFFNSINLKSLFHAQRPSVGSYLSDSIGSPR
jgi:hypothetical protein